MFIVDGISCIPSSVGFVSHGRETFLALVRWEQNARSVFNGDGTVNLGMNVFGLAQVELPP